MQAIFTREENWKGRVPAAIGLLAGGSGATLWSLLIIQGSSSLSLVSLSILLVTVGVGLSVYSLSVRRTRQENNRLRSALYDLEVLVEPKTGPTDSTNEADVKNETTSAKPQPRRVSRTLALAVTEAVILVIIYAGLVQEYASNINMQRWVRTNVWPGAFILNYNALFLVLGGLLGTLVFQLVMRKQDTS